MNPVLLSDPTDVRLEPYRDIRERDLVGREGLFIAEGKVVLNVLLSSNLFEPVSLLVAQSRVEGIRELLDSLPAGVPVYVCRQAVMDTIAGFSVHRGILALARRKQASVPEDLPFGKDALVVVASAISNHDNMGAIFRNAASFNVDHVLLDRQCCNPLYRKSIRVSVGAALQVPFEHGADLPDILAQLTHDGFHIAALSPSGVMPVTRLPRGGRRALLLGSEGHGLPSAVLDRLSTWSIPMSDRFDSLNVAAASAIALFHSTPFCNRN